jgi:hypothetical protein
VDLTAQDTVDRAERATHPSKVVALARSGKQADRVIMLAAARMMSPISIRGYRNLGLLIRGHGERGVQQLLSVLSSSTSSLTSMVLLQLLEKNEYALSSSEFGLTLCSLSSHWDPKMRRSVARVLGRCSVWNQSIERALKRLMEDDDRTVRQVASRSLKRRQA